MRAFTKLKKIIKRSGGVLLGFGDDGLSCQFYKPNHEKLTYSLCVIASWGEGWDHVSIHCQHNDDNFTPFWEDMAYIKQMFFKASETVIQYHPASDAYVNIHPHTLHLWRQHGVEIKLPPRKLI